ncbi:MAG: hypothetical protein V1897_02040, partial [Pseudomonadota bacterium]
MGTEMDLDTEKEKAKYLHKLELVRLIIDRLLIGLILVAIGFGFNLALEDYKRKQIEHQFYLERKLEAVNSIREAYIKAFNTYYWTTISDKDKAKSLLFRGEPDTEYHNTIVNLGLAVSKYNILLSRYFFDLATANTIMLEGIYYKEPLKRIEYREFVYHLAQVFSNQSRIELGLSPELEANESFPFETFKFEEIHTKGSPHFLDINFEKWK